MNTPHKKYCSFCGKNDKEVLRLFYGPGNVAICNECIILMLGMFDNQYNEPISMNAFRKRLADRINHKVNKI